MSSQNTAGSVRFHNQLLGYVLRTEEANDRYDVVMPGHQEVFGQVCV